MSWRTTDTLEAVVCQPDTKQSGQSLFFEASVRKGRKILLSSASKVCFL